MKKHTSLRNAVLALLIFGLLAFVCYAAIFTVLAVYTKDFNFFLLHFEQLVRVFGPSKYYLPLTIGVYIVLGNIVLLFSMMLAVCVVKGKATTVLPWLLSALSLFGLMELIANMGRYTIAQDKVKCGYVAMYETTDLAAKIMALALTAMVIICVMVSFTAYVLAFVYTLLYKKQRKARVLNRVAPAQNVAALEQNQPEYFETKFEQEPEPVVEPEPEPVPEQKEEKVDMVELIRQIIREELHSQNNPSSNVTGASFSSPLIVQYFNGLSSQPAAQPEPVKEEQPQEPEPVAEEEPVQEEPVVEETPVEEPVVEEPAPEEAPEKPKIIRIPFEVRMAGASEEMKRNYNEIKNDIMAYGVHSRVSNSGDTFRLHRKTFVKLTIAGKSLKLYFALNPNDYMSSTFPIGNAGDKNIYAEIPLIFKVKSGLSVKRAKQLIFDVMNQNGLVQGEVESHDWAEDIATAVKEGKFDNSDDGDASDEEE